MSTKTDLDTVLQHSPSVVYRDLDKSEGGVLLHLETGGYFSVNPTGRDVWQLLDGVRALREVAVRLRDAHPDGGDQLTADVLAFGQVITDRGLALPTGPVRT